MNCCHIDRGGRFWYFYFLMEQKSLFTIPKLKIFTPGLIAYDKAYLWQKGLWQARKEGRICDSLILLEHPPVITAGRRTESSHIVLSEAQRQAMEIDVFEIERGGEATYHGPGQTVGYLIFDLKGLQKDIKGFIWSIEELFIKLLKEEFKISAGRDPQNRGVWIENDKITALGISIRSHISMHGFAFNVCPDLSHYQWIVPCGIKDKGVTSLANVLGKEISTLKILPLLIRYFCDQFGVKEKEVIDGDKAQAALADYSH